MKKLLIFIAKFIFGSAYPYIEKRYSYLIRKFKGRGYYAINELDKKLEKYVNYDNGFFVELGANDGVQQSNSLYFEQQRGWKGVLVEPSPHNFIQCKLNRNPKNFIFCNACVDFDYKKKYVDIQYANLMTISKNLHLDLNNSSDHINLAKKNLKKYEEVFEFGSVAKTLTELLTDSNAPKLIDFLSIDVEGAELSVLRGIDFKKFNFRYILIEIRNFDRVSEFLNKFNYQFIEKFSKHDYLFKYKNFDK